MAKRPSATFSSERVGHKLEFGTKAPAIPPTPFYGFDLARGESVSALVMHDGKGNVIQFRIPKNCPRFLYLNSDLELMGSDNQDGPFEKVLGVTRIA
jgi:hypothetical protein